MESYFEAKMRLFDEVIAPGGTAVIWADDARSADVAARARARGLSILSIGEKGETLRLLSRTPTHLGQVLMIEADGKTHRVVLPLIGAYQAANALTSAGLVMAAGRSEEHTSELQSLMRISYAVFYLKKKNTNLIQ